MSYAENTRATAGHNIGEVDYSREESDRLRRDYADTFRMVEELLTEYETIPESLATPDDKARTVSLIKRMRDTGKALLGYQALEGMPHLRKKQGVDQTFFGEHDRLAKRDRKDKDGAADVLNKRLTDYDTAELARIQARRRQEALEARMEADRVLAEAEEAEREAAKARRVADEAKAAAERARKPETIAARQMEAAAASVAAEKLQDESIALKGNVAVAEAQAERAHIDTLARPADLMRERHADGSQSGMADEKFWEITDRQALNLEALRPYFDVPSLEKALRGYAASHAYSNDASVQIAGARFGKRAKSRVR